MLTLDQQDRECEKLYELAKTMKWDLLVACDEVKPQITAYQWYVWKNSNTRHSKLSDTAAKKKVAKLLERNEIDDYTKQFLSEMTKNSLYPSEKP